MIDRHAALIASDHRDDLGGWIQRRLKKGVEGQGGKAQGVLNQVGICVEELRAQWELQQASQLSIHARTPDDTESYIKMQTCTNECDSQIQQVLHDTGDAIQARMGHTTT